MIRNKTAVVTGAGSKINKAIIESINQEYLVIKHKLRPEEGYHHGDLSDVCDVGDFFSKINNIDLMVCGAGGIKAINSERPCPDECIHIDPEQARELFERNFFSAYLCCRYGVPKMKQGNLIMIGSAVVSKPREKGEVAMYACAKAALHEYTIHLAKELEGRIRVNCLATDGHEIDKIVNAVDEILNSDINGQIIRLER